MRVWGLRSSVSDDFVQGSGDVFLFMSPWFGFRGGGSGLRRTGVVVGPGLGRGFRLFRSLG